MNQAENETEIKEVEQEEPEQEEQEAEEAESPESEAAETTDEVTVTIGEDSPASEDEQQDSEPIRQMRRELRDKARAERELRQELESLKAQNQPKPAVEPTLESCDYDEGRYKAELSTFFARKGEEESRQAKHRAELEAQQKTLQERVQTFVQQKAALKVSDYADVEEQVAAVLSPIQQHVIVSAADNAAIVVYALGKNPTRMKELAAITDPVKFAFAVAKLETQMKVKPRTVPGPEKKVSGSGPIRGNDATLERLEAEADKTGDRSKVYAYKRKLRAVA